MEIKDILKKVDHTLLSPFATKESIEVLLDEGIKNHVASCCIPPCYVSFSSEYVRGKLPICTVVGFPNGYSLTDVKVFETEKALEDGTDEIDMVINIAMVKNAKYSEVQREIERLRDICKGKILKVIVEACFLNEEEKIKMCKIITETGADYIKTSTGFGSGGAVLDDIKLFKTYIGPKVKIKAAGGISSLGDAVKFIEYGAERLGSSKMIKLVNGAADER